jgi:2-isopropylmalate synthase
MRKIDVFDTTLRDGEQSPGCSLNGAEKLEIAHQLARLGVDVIEAGFAASSPGDFAAVRTIAEQVRGPVITALARGVKSDIDAVAEAVKPAERPRIHIVVSASNIHLERKMRKSKDDVLQMGVESVRYARSLCDDVEYSTEDASRADLDYLCRTLEEVIKAGATVVNIPDTVGFAVPGEWYEAFSAIMHRVPNIDKARISVHCHNDLGMAAANSLEAIRAGATQVEGCFNGIGERAGNASLEEIIMALDTRKDHFGVDIGIDTTQIYPSSRMVSRISGMAVQANKAVVGENAFRHASGIHQDGVLKDRSTYEVMKPERVGLPPDVQLVLGKLSGRAGLQARLETLGYSLDREEVTGVYQRFLELADKKPEITDRDLEILMDEDSRGSGEPISYTLDQVQFSGGDHGIATATVRLIDPEGIPTTDAATGNGPVNAICNAIDRAIGVVNRLVDFNVQAATEGRDSLGTVTIRIEKDGKTYTGRGADTDIVVASAKAYLSAVNRQLASDESANVPALGSTPD